MESKKHNLSETASNKDKFNEHSDQNSEDESPISENRKRLNAELKAEYDRSIRAFEKIYEEIYPGHTLSK